MLHLISEFVAYLVGFSIQSYFTSHEIHEQCAFSFLLNIVLALRILQRTFYKLELKFDFRNQTMHQNLSW